MFKAVIFDMDGVLINSEPLHHRSERELLGRYGVSITDEALQSYAGKDAVQLLNELIRNYHLNVRFPEFYAEHKDNLERVFRESSLETCGADSLLKSLAQLDIPLGLASSTHRSLINLILNKLNLTELFRTVVGGDEIEKGKPYPDIYLAAARQLNLSPRFCVAIEDSKNGVQSAKEAGLYCIGYQNPTSGNQDLSRADRIVHQFSEIHAGELFSSVVVKKGQGSQI